MSRRSRRAGLPVAMISALKNKGVEELIAAAKRTATAQRADARLAFDRAIEDVLGAVEAELPASVADDARRYYAVKLFERDAEAAGDLALSAEATARVESLVAACERDCDDDAELHHHRRAVTGLSPISSMGASKRRRQR